VRLVEKPERPGATPDIRFLDQAELEALLTAVPDDARGPTERAIYLTAAMTGLRQGELIALRWRDVDWTAGRIRVRQNFVRGEFGTPKVPPVESVSPAS
jgi:integrase